MKTTIAIFIFCLFTLLGVAQKNKAIFLVHSTGTSLYSEGKVSDWVKTYNSVNGTNFQIATRAYPNTPWPWENYPYDYWKLWVNNSCDNTDLDIECLPSIASNYGLVIFKHCYPGAGIGPDTGKPDVTSKTKSLENYKLQYRALRTLIDGMPDKKFMVWTLVPLHRLATTTDQASRANEFVNWVKNQWLTEDGKPHTNISIFDFYSQAAEMNENPTNGKQYCLKYDYEYSHTSNDSHPNTLANTTIGPLFAQAVVKVLSTNHITNISVSAQNGATSIITDKGTLQLQASILPADATTKIVTWSVLNVTGKASINTSGLIAAEKDGTVKAIATANDGSGIKGEMLVTISNQLIPVESISVTSVGGTTINTDNGTLQVSASILPADATNKSLIWSVVNVTGKASINTSGLVTAEKDGTVKAIATTNDGSGIKGEMLVTISNQHVLIENLQIIDNLKNDTINGIGTKINLKASILPQDTTNPDVDWAVENITGKASIEKDGVLITSSPGLIKVIAMAMDDSNIQSHKEYIIAIPVGFQQHINSQNIKIFPNPTRGKIQIQVDQIPTEGVTIEIRNFTGQILIKKRVFENLSEWSLEQHPSSIYFVTIIDKKNVFTQKIVNIISK